MLYCKEAREIVKKYLSSKKGFILVSHDRDLLDACIDHCLVLNRSTIEVQNGNFSTWWENKQRKDQFALSENEKHQIEKLLLTYQPTMLFVEHDVKFCEKIATRRIEL